MKKLASLIVIMLLGNGLMAQNFDWVSSFTSVGSSGSFHLETDDGGNVYTVGRFHDDMDFDPSGGEEILPAHFFGTCYISKLDSEGNLIWAKALGTTGDSQGNSVKVDGMGNVYIAGTFGDTVDFDPGIGEEIMSTSDEFDDQDAFILKLNADGEFIWVKAFQGLGSDRISAINFSADGNILAIGQFHEDLDIDPGAGTHILTSNGVQDVFMVQLSPAGDLNWGHGLGGEDYDSGNAIFTDVDNNVYLAGLFSLVVDFDPGAGESILESPLNYDGFICKFTDAGDFIWTKQLASSGTASCRDIEMDNSGNVWATGSYSGTVDLDPGLGEANNTSEGSADVFILKLDADGNYTDGGSMSGVGNNWSNELAIDQYNNVYITGPFKETVDFDPGVAEFELTSNGDQDTYIVKFNENIEFLWATSFGGIGNDHAYGLALDAEGNIYTSGNFAETVDFDPGDAVAEKTSAGGFDIFVHKLNQENVGVESNFGTQSILFNCYPNPTKEGIYISSNSTEIQTVEVKLYAINGELVYDQGALLNGQIFLDLSQYPNGAYYIEITTAEFREIQKIIKI